MNINHTKMTLEINSCKNYEILEVRQGDKGSRIIDFAFTVNGETVNLASTMSAKVNATVDDVIVADSVAAVVDTENNVVTVTLTDTMLALSGICKMDIVLMEGDEIITAETVCLRVGKSVINDDSKAFPGASSIAEITKEVENARGSHDSLGARLDTVDTNLTKKADKTSTLAGYGIVNAYTKTEMLNLLAKKEDNSNKVSDSSQITDYTQNYPSIKYLTDNYWDSADSYSSDEVDILLNAKADNKPLNERLARMDMSIGSKYDSSNIELGTATLTPYSTLIDKIKSATCLYEKIGDIVIVNVTVIMNATTLGGTSAISLLNMPFPNKSDVIVHDIGISKNGGMFRGSVNKSAWLQFTPLNKQAYDFVADEQVNFSLIYKI
ncbi:MAG TPA: phage baseplate upper protein [Ruminococcus bromii]|nr:BppU family phage baseplate upper protein [Ruminococcus bromii]HJI63493.1 phage baseplate upper protein [Ruminococcus bromii]